MPSPILNAIPEEITTALVTVMRRLSLARLVETGPVERSAADCRQVAKEVVTDIEDALILLRGMVEGAPA